MLDDVNTKEQFRILLQWWGTEYRRRLFRDDYWLVALSKKIEQYQNEDAIVVITDIRFPNEFEYIKSLGGHMVRIARPDLNQSGDAHFSETALDNEENFDTFIDNNGSLEQFKAIVETYYASGEISTPKKIVSVAR
jgi:ribulose bisphosphate carboxylase small subunit